MAKRQYTLDSDRVQARERLAAVERNYDAITIEHLVEIGVSNGLAVMVTISCA